MNTKRVIELLVLGLVYFFTQSCSEITDFSNEDMKKYPWLEEMLIDYHNQSVKGKHNLDLGTVQFEYMISSTSQEEFREFMDSVTVAKHWQIVKKKESVYVIQKDFNETDSYHQSKQLTIELVQEDQKVKCFID